MHFKSGWRTTEFWLTSLVNIAATAVVSGLIPVGGPAVQIAALALSALSTLGYTTSRAVVKSKQPK